VPSTEPDVLRWIPATNGRCTSKSSYIHLQQQQNHSLPSLGSGAISSLTHNILNRIWKSKTIPPLLKTFSWRLFHHALPTADRAGRFSTNIGNLCTVCYQIENDTHLFFLCQLPQQVWAAINTPPFIHLIDLAAEGVQQILPHDTYYH
jgi:hypothetical protein